MQFSETTSSSLPNIQQAEQVLHNVFGFEEFRSLQKNIIQNVLQKKDTLAIMPTGGGKSLCYQIPALLFDGITIVVSPLISLMKDQVDQLKAYGVSATFLNSSLSAAEYISTEQRVRNGDIDLLYLAPETLMKNSVLDLLSGLQVDCFAIDEAHCISEWGHDFRPEYRQLAQVKSTFKNAVCLALTATATPQVQNDIATSLGLANANTFIASFDRQNLFLDIVNKSNPLQQTVEFLNKHEDQSGIIYCFSRRQVDELAIDLEANGFSVLPYHAGLSEDKRVHHQESFIHDEVDIIVATIAFGMGIDKPDVRFVIHHDMPKNIESYYQQIGRAGRDSLRADCLFLFSYGDAGKIRYFINQKSDEEQQVANQHLEDLLGFVEARECRRIPLLDYFGETYTGQPCGMCDFCTGDVPDTKELTIPVQKFLSTVARTGQTFGFHHIKDVLLGSKQKKLLQLQHDQLSTYGIGNELSRGQWKQLYRELIRQDVITKDGQYGGVKLTPTAISILKGEEEFFGVIEEQKKSGSGKSRVSAESLDYDHALFKLLKEKRTALAKEGDVPPYIIFADKTLMEMAYFFPQSESSLLAIHGVGAAKKEKYGTKFLQIIQTYSSENNLKEKSKSEQVQAPPKQKVIKKSSRSYQVGAMFKAGKSVTEIADHFDNKETTVIQNLGKYVKSGYEIPPANLKNHSSLSEAEFDKVTKTFNEHGSELLRPVFEALNEEISYDELRVIQLYMMTQNIE